VRSRTDTTLDLFIIPKWYPQKDTKKGVEKNDYQKTLFTNTTETNTTETKHVKDDQKNNTHETENTGKVSVLSAQNIPKRHDKMILGENDFFNEVLCPKKELTRRPPKG